MLVNSSLASRLAVIVVIISPIIFLINFTDWYWKFVVSLNNHIIEKPLV